MCRGHEQSNDAKGAKEDDDEDDGNGNAAAEEVCGGEFPV